ncbi:MAG: MBL fold metallo-hydrolase [Actinomycetota bacterium]|nr:MBL fold metallo-hydrolase [Actinomycetota bacterium]
METTTTAIQDTEPFLCGALVGDGVRRFDDGIVNWYLIEDDAGLTVVDCGFPAGWSMLMTALGTMGRRLADVRAVIITHGHIDHIGFAERARQEAGATVYVHEGDVPLLKSPLNIARSQRNPLMYLNHSATRKVMARAMSTGAPFAKRVQEYTTFEDGEVLAQVPGRPSVVHTPGHTDGHTAFHLQERDIVFAGDAVVTRDPYTGQVGPRIPARAATNDSGQALRSLDRLAATDASLVLTGHGEPWREGAEEAARLARAAGAP